MLLRPLPEQESAYAGATNDGMVRTAGCGVDAISKIGYVDAAPPNELSDLPWEQLCSVGAACGLGSDLAVGCHDMDNDGAVIVASVPRPKHSCSDGEIVQAIYARWDGRAVQAIDGVSCRRTPTPAALSDLCQSQLQPVLWVQAHGRGQHAARCACLRWCCTPDCLVGVHCGTGSTDERTYKERGPRSLGTITDRHVTLRVFWGSFGGMPHSALALLCAPHCMCRTLAALEVSCVPEAALRTRPAPLKEGFNCRRPAVPCQRAASGPRPVTHVACFQGSTHVPRAMRLWRTLCKAVAMIRRGRMCAARGLQATTAGA